MVIADSEVEVVTKLSVWKEGLEMKGMRVNLFETMLTVGGRRHSTKKLKANGHVQFVVKVLAQT